MKFAASLTKLLAALRVADTGTRAQGAALPAPLIVALEPRIVYDASAASIGAAATAQHHQVGAEAHTSAARDTTNAPAAVSSFAAAAGSSAAASTRPVHGFMPITQAMSASGTSAQTATATDTATATARHGYTVTPATNGTVDTTTMRAVHGYTDRLGASTDTQVVFVNSNVTDYQTLVAGLPQGTQVVILDSAKDGLAQMEQYLQQHPGVSAIHLVSHGYDGNVQIGSTWLNQGDLSTYSTELAQIGAAMKPGGDFLIYGCDVAQNADGKAFVQQIASISGLNVAASTDATGAATLGGDWTLEYDAGAVHTGVVFSSASEQSYDHVLAAYDETYDGSVGYDSGTTPVASTTLGTATLLYTGDQAVEYQIVGGSLPGSGSGGELVVNTQGTQMSTLTIARQDGTLMGVQSFDIDVFVSNQVTVQALDSSGSVMGTVVLDVSAGATAYTPGHVSSSSLFHVDLSSNAAFSQAKSIKLVETSGNGTYLSPTLDNLTYIAPSAPPTLTATGGSTSFVAGDNVASTPVAVDSGITLSDGNSTTAVSATVSITGNLHSTEDVLSFTNTSAATYGNVAAAYNAGTGVLTLTSSGGTATLAQWQAALRAVTYSDTAITPNATTRTISFEITSDGFTAGNTTTKAVSVTDTDQTPVVTTAGHTITSYPGGASTTIDSGITVSDRDNTTQSSGTVSVSGGFHSGDTLSFTNDGSTMGNIAGSYNAATGVLTLTSSGAIATDAQWARALSAVTFSSTSTTLGNRTISFTTSDGTKTSTAATDTVNVANPLQLTTDSGSAAFVAGDNTASTPVAIDSGLTLSDTATTTLASATVAITGNYINGEDFLVFTNNGSTMGNITGSYQQATGVLTLTSAGGTATVAQWQNALRSVTYTDTAVTPNPSTRTISFSATDSLSNTSTMATRTVTVTDTDQSPIVTTTGGTTNYVGGTSATTIDSGITVSDRDNTTQSSGTVSIGSGLHSGDTLSFTNDGSTMGNIAGSYNAATGVLTLTSSGATATDAQWARALSAVTFSSTSTTYGNRTISFATSDGTKTSTAGTDTINMTAPPRITTDSGSAAFVAGDNAASTPVAIDSGLTVTDGSATTLASTTVAITSGFHSGDMLSFTNDGSTMGNITASYNAGTGVMTLTSSSASATLAQWQSALQSVTYTNTAVTPDNTTRTIGFTSVDGAGNTSATATRTVTITDTDQTPIVTTTGGSTSYVGASLAVTIDGHVVVSDRDNSTQTSATVAVTTGFHTGDVLSFTNDGATMGNIQASYSAGTGVLLLTSIGSSATNAQWASALSSVTFSSTSTTYGDRAIWFQVNDGTKNSTQATDTVHMTAPPALTTDSGSAAFVAGDNTASTPVAIDSGLTVTDGSATTLGSTTVAITGGFASGEDVLSFTNDGSTMGNITASYNAGTGVMTLTSASATATLAQWQSALRSVTYTDTAVTPNNATRTISFTSVDGAGNTSATATRTVSITDTDQTPIVTTTGGTTNYVGGTAAAAIDGGISVSDLDNTTQSSGTVSVSGGFHSGDTLSFANDGSTMGNISASYNAATGVLTLTSAGATATDAQWSSALKSVTFSSASTTYGNRTISFATSDGTKTSVARTDTVNVTAPPLITTDSGSAAFVAGDNTASTPVAIDSGLTVTDGSATTLGSTTVAITGGFASGEDVLSFRNDGSTMGNIAASYNAGTGVMTLTSTGATATLAQWQSALRSVTYTDTAVTPNNATRTISFTSVDGAGNTSATATRTVSITDTDQTPIVTTTGGTTNYVGGTAAATIDGGISVSDRDNTTQSSGTVSITSGFHSGDTLTFVNSSPTTFGNIVGSYNAATGVLTLTSSGATATSAQWSHALSATTFSASSSATPGDRTVSFAVSDGTKTSAVATDTVTLLGPPTIGTDSGSASFVAGDNVASTPVAIDPGLTLTDGVSPTLASTTVAVTGNFHSGEDVLGFTNTGAATYGNIAASYNAATGVLTLTSSGASATLAQWQAALAAVTYTNTAVTPNNATRTVSFTAVDSSAITSNTATRTVSVTDTDQTPIVTTTGGTTNYVGGTAAATIDGGISVSDLDNTTQSSGTVSVSGGFHSGDTLSFTNDGSTMGNISASYNAATGVLTLTSAGATATDAQWSSALKSVTFSSASTTYGNRTISFATSDGTKTSVARTDTVNVTAPPLITTDSGSAAFVAGDNTASTPVAIDSGLTVTDGSATTLGSTTVAITGGFASGEDVLSFRNDGSTMGNITASYNAGTGVMTLTSTGATATLAQWQSALRSVTYTDTAVTPNNATRTISFTSVDGAGNTSATTTRTVSITDTDQTPIVTTTGGTTNYVAGTAAATVDGAIAVTDRDTATQSAGTVAITTGFESGDTLRFVNTNATTFGNIVASYNASTGVLTLTSSGATATDAQWSNALSAVTFSASASATPGSRALSFTVTDGVKTSAVTTDTVQVLAPPKLTTDSGSASFVAGDNASSTPVTIDSGLTLTDGGAPTLASATVAITGNFHSGEDVLGFANTDAATYGNIAASYDSATGVLTLSSANNSATLAQWQAALDAVTYTDTAVTPNNATRTISFAATDSNSNASNTATRTVSVTDTDQTPIVTTTGGTALYVTGSTGTIVNPHVSVTDLDNATQSSATASITGGFHPGDVLAFTNTNAATFGNIVASYDSATGVLTFTSAGATATDAQWSNALSAATFSSSGANFGDRTISFATSDGTKASAAATATVSVFDRPHVTTDAGAASFVAGDNATSTPVVVSPGLTLTDASVTGSGHNVSLSSATVSITGGFHAGQDVLTFANDGATMGNIQASYDANTGVLTLTSAGGTASLTNWRSALASVTYTDTAVVPDNTARTISFTVTDSNGAASDVQARTVTVTDTDQTPTLAVSGNVTFTSQVIGSTPVAVAPQVTVGDRDPSAALTSAQVAITGGFDPAHDTLAFGGTGLNGFGSRYDATTGTLTLTWTGSGNATLAQWRGALESVTYANSAFRASGSRTVTFTISDGVKTSVAATNTIAIVTGRAGGTPSSALPTTTPFATDTSAQTPSPHLTAADNAPAPEVLGELRDRHTIGSLPVVPTMTFSDPGAPAESFSIDRATVSRFDVAALDAALGATPSSMMLSSLSDIAIGVPERDPFAIEVATLLPPSVALHQAMSDVTVQMANGRSLPGWLHYDAASGVLRGKVPPGVHDVRIAVQVRDATGHVTHRDVVLAPHRGDAGHDANHQHQHQNQHPHHPANPNGHAARDLAQPLAARAARPVGKPSLDQQFAQARAALHVVRPASTVRRV